MLSSPTVESLLQTHGRTLKGRQAARAALAEALMESAQLEAQRAAQERGLSINCADDMRYGIPPDKHRCRNDGSGCLCECHDPPS